MKWRIKSHKIGLLSIGLLSSCFLPYSVGFTAVFVHCAVAVAELAAEDPVFSIGCVSMKFVAEMEGILTFVAITQPLPLFRPIRSLYVVYISVTVRDINYKDVC